MPSRRLLGSAITVLLAWVSLVACGSGAGPGSGTRGTTGSGHVIHAVASINAWGSIVSQLGGTRVHTISLITNPSTDPHDYEPTTADGRAIAGADLLIENGIGYDSWAAKAAAVDASTSRTVIDVGTVVGVPAGGNPHRWYSPSDVTKVADAVTADLKQLDPADADYFEGRRHEFETTGLADYHRLITQIKTRYAGTPVGASESIFAPLAEALDLTLVTPPSFLKAISEGVDPSAADKTTIDTQIRDRQIKVYVFNSQNSTPDVSAQVAAARAAGIPVASVTETLSPAGATFQEWQSSQLTALQHALATAR